LAEKLKTKTNLTTAGRATKAAECVGAILIRPNVRYLSRVFCGEKNFNEIGIVSVHPLAVVRSDKNGKTIKTGGPKIRPRRNPRLRLSTYGGL